MRVRRNVEIRPTQPPAPKPVSTNRKKPVPAPKPAGKTAPENEENQ